MPADTDEGGSPPMLDETALRLLKDVEAEGGPALLGELIRLFEALSPGRLDRIEQAMAREEWEPLLREAHSLKSSSATLGARRLASLCKSLETGVKVMKVEERKMLMDGLREEFRQVSRGLERYKP